MRFRTGAAVLLADCLQRVQSAFDVTDLCRQGVYRLHGAIQLLTASHQRVHALWEQRCKRQAMKELQSNDGNITRIPTSLGVLL